MKNAGLTLAESRWMATSVFERPGIIRGCTYIFEISRGRELSLCSLAVTLLAIERICVVCFRSVSVWIEQRCKLTRRRWDNKRSFGWKLLKAANQWKSMTCRSAELAGIPPDLTIVRRLPSRIFWTLNSSSCLPIVIARPIYGRLSHCWTSM